jgi:serine/threonine protein phosphatase 1
MSRTYVIADLHGRFDLLCRTLDLIHADAGDLGGTLIVLGDFVDRGPQSRNIIDLLMTGPSRPNWEWIALQGNHEAMMLEALSAPNANLMRWWVGNGGGQTLQSYGYASGDDLLPLKVPVEHLEWLASLPVYHEDQWRIFVHAGVPSHQPVAEAKVETLQWMLYPSDEDYPDAEVHDDARHCSGKHIVHGHHQSASHPLLKPHRTNLDSFAWNTGRLAIGVFEDDYPAPVKIMDAIGRPA